MNPIQEGKIKMLISIIQALVKQKFWGEVVIKFKDGVPIIIQENKQIKLGDE